MVKVIGVKFKTGGRVYFFDPLNLEIHTGDGVIVETARGEEFGDVVSGPMEVAEEKIVAPLKPVLRVATEEDWRQRRLYASKESEAFAVCLEKIQAHKLDMKLVDVEYTYNGSKVVFYFTADERVDFRELVKDLAYVFKTRIELRQIGVRDEAKMLGGLGPCGRPVCCKTFLDDFRPVSIKMAKEQNLSLSPTKISGLCGRLMCCLQYEEEAYEYMRKLMPKVGKEIETPDGVGTVTENNVLTERTKVRIAAADGTYEIREYPYTILGPGAAERQEALAAGEEGAEKLFETPPMKTAERPRQEKNRNREKPRQEKPKKEKPVKEEKADKTEAQVSPRNEGGLSVLPGESLSGRMVLPGESLTGSTVNGGGEEAAQPKKNRKPNRKPQGDKNQEDKNQGQSGEKKPGRSKKNNRPKPDRRQMEEDAELAPAGREEMPKKKRRPYHHKGKGGQKPSQPAAE